MSRLSGDQITVHAEGWNQYLKRLIAPRWAPVCRNRFPDESDESLDWTWTFLQYVFPLDDPRSFALVADAQWSPSERDVLARYLSHARDLAGTEVLTAPQGYSVS